MKPVKLKMWAILNERGELCVEETPDELSIFSTRKDAVFWGQPRKVIPVTVTIKERKERAVKP